MKYWIFQNNQVLGPYEPDDLRMLPAFAAESLVCPEGRRGTSMGDWQRAGMVPDLSVALVKAAQAHNVASPVATLAGLPPEPTLKDLAVLGSLQEKVRMMEDVVLQLQDGLRLKDAELSVLHEKLAGKDRESIQFKKESEEMRKEAATLKDEIEARKRDEEALKVDASEFKLKIAELEERVGAINRLSETIERAVEAEKHVEHDVETQGAALTELAKEIGALREQIQQRLESVSMPPSTQPPPAPPEPLSLPSLPATPEPQPLPEASGGAPEAPAEPTPPLEIVVEPPATPSEPTPPLEASVEPPAMPSAPPALGEPPFVDPFAGVSLAPEPAAPAPVEAGPAPVPAKSGRKTGLAIGGALILAALAGLVLVPGLRKPQVPASLDEPVPPPPPAEEPPAAPASEPDLREQAIAAAKEKILPDGRALAGALETISPPSGNLSPWMAEPLPDGRVQVNYFARGAAPGAPTVAYEFEVDPVSRLVIGRNAAAKGVLAGKSAVPPASPKPRPVKVKPKSRAPTPPVPPSGALDSLLGGDKVESLPGFEADQSKKADGKADDEALLDDILKD